MFVHIFFVTVRTIFYFFICILHKWKYWIYVVPKIYLFIVYKT